MARPLLLALAMAIPLPGCDSGEPEELPETPPRAVQSRPDDLAYDGGTTVGPDDVGRRITATGRVAGSTLAAVEVGLFEGWERDAFGDDLEAEWDFERGYYLSDADVVPLEPGVVSPSSG